MNYNNIRETLIAGQPVLLDEGCCGTTPEYIKKITEFSAGAPNKFYMHISNIIKKEV